MCLLFQALGNLFFLKDPVVFSHILYLNQHLPVSTSRTQSWWLMVASYLLFFLSNPPSPHQFLIHLPPYIPWTAYFSLLYVHAQTSQREIHIPLTGSNSDPQNVVCLSSNLWKWRLTGKRVFASEPKWNSLERDHLWVSRQFLNPVTRVLMIDRRRWKEEGREHWTEMEVMQPESMNFKATSRRDFPVPMAIRHLILEICPSEREKKKKKNLITQFGRIHYSSHGKLMQPI